MPAYITGAFLHSLGGEPTSGDRSSTIGIAKTGPAPKVIPAVRFDRVYCDQIEDGGSVRYGHPLQTR